MIRSSFKKLQEHVRTARGAVADIAAAVGAPKMVTSMIQPDEKNDPWANPVSVQSAEDNEAQASAEAEPEAKPEAKPVAEASAPATSDASADERAKAVSQVLNDMVNPAVASHGGFINLVEVKENKVFVEMGGGCQGCGAAKMTLKAGVERMLQEELPWIEEVVDVTDHGGGDSPYYSM